jgi:hypothetical protein
MQYLKDEDQQPDSERAQQHGFIEPNEPLIMERPGQLAMIGDIESSGRSVQPPRRSGRSWQADDAGRRHRRCSARKLQSVACTVQTMSAAGKVNDPGGFKMSRSALLSVALLVCSFSAEARPNAAPAADHAAAGTAWVVAAGVSFGPRTERVAGSGNVIEDRRALSGFSAIHMSGPVDVELRASDREAVTVKADDNVAPLIETVIVPGDRPALSIGMKPQSAFRAARAPVVIVEFVAIAEIVMRGSGDLRADRVEASDLAISMSGSGDARIGSLSAELFAAVLAGSGDLAASGRADQQAYRIAGSGDVAAGKLVGRSVKVSIAGSGDASVHATESLEVRIAGSGDVVYRGSPRISQRIAGSGAVRRAR